MGLIFSSSQCSELMAVPNTVCPEFDLNLFWCCHTWFVCFVCEKLVQKNPINDFFFIWMKQWEYIYIFYRSVSQRPSRKWTEASVFWSVYHYLWRPAVFEVNNIPVRFQSWEQSLSRLLPEACPFLRSLSVWEQRAGRRWSFPVHWLDEELLHLVDAKKVEKPRTAIE